MPRPDWLSWKMNTKRMVDGSVLRFLTSGGSRSSRKPGKTSPIWAEYPLLGTFLDQSSLMRSTSCWYRFRSLAAVSLAFLSRDSRDLTRSAVARRRFSCFGSSQRRSALSCTSCTKVKGQENT